VLNQSGIEVVLTSVITIQKGSTRVNKQNAYKNAFAPGTLDGDFTPKYNHPSFA
jgi:hypothetical protein